MDAIDNKRAKAFIDDIIELSKKHGLSLAHEDRGGSFEVEEFSEYNIKWLRNFDVREW